MYAEFGEFADLGGLAALLGGAFAIVMFIAGLISLLSFIATCVLYKKAGEHWWATLIPIYNMIVFLRMADKKWWWIFVLLIPIVPAIIVMVDFLKNFGKPGSHVLLLLFFGPIYWPILAFSKSTVFKGGAAGEQAAA